MLAQFDHKIYFPQVAVGGGYTTSFVIMNTGGTSAPTGVLFFRPDGTINSAYQQFVTIPVGGSVRFQAASSGPLSVMWARAESSGPIEGVATFDLRTGGGELEATAGVLGIEAGSTFLLPVDVTPAESTGVAIANTTTSPVNVRLRLLRENGALYRTVDDPRLNSLGSRNHVAAFVNEFFPELAGTTFRGSLVVEALSGTNPIVATALTIKDGMLSALPVIPVPSAGGSSGSSINLTGTFESFSITDTSGVTFMRWVLVQNGNDVTGTAFISSPLGTTGSGTIAGTLNGDSLTFTIAMPAGGYTPSIFASCTGEASGTAENVTADLIAGGFTGTNSCTPGVPISAIYVMHRRQ